MNKEEIREITIHGSMSFKKGAERWIKDAKTGHREGKRGNDK